MLNCNIKCEKSLNNSTRVTWMAAQQNCFIASYIVECEREGNKLRNETDNWEFFVFQFLTSLFKWKKH